MTRKAVLCGISAYGPYGNLDGVPVELARLEQVLRHEVHEDFRFAEVTPYLDEQLTLGNLRNLLTFSRVRIS